MHIADGLVRRTHAVIHVYCGLCEAPATQLPCHGGAPPPTPPPCAPVHTSLCHPEGKHTVGLPGVSVLATLPLQNLPYLILGTYSSGGLLSKHTGKEAFAALIKSSPKTWSASSELLGTVHDGRRAHTQSIGA